MTFSSSFPPTPGDLKLLLLLLIVVHFLFRGCGVLDFWGMKTELFPKSEVTDLRFY